FIFGASLYFAKFLGAGGQGIEVGTAADGSNINEILTQIIQLIVLCIPLVALPLLIKSSASIMGKVGSYADKFGGATAGKMTNKAQSGIKGGVKKIPGIREGFEGVEQYKGARAAAGSRNKASRAVRRSGVLGRIPGRATSEILGASARSQQDKIFNEEVGMHAAEIAAHAQGGDVGWLSDQLVQEATSPSGDASRARALQKALASQKGRGAPPLREAYEQIGAVGNEEMQRALRGGASQDYGDIAESARDTAGWNFATGQSGEFGAGMTPEQMATQSLASMDRYEAEQGNITPEMAQRTLASPMANKLNDDTYARLVQRAGPGFNPPPPPNQGGGNPPNNPPNNPPPPNPGGGGNPPNQPPPPGFDQTPGGLWVPH
ncbi:hypothetical protein HY004_01745, partial [Candidatus Saccharibacteria bacterium]|nr:hypothetical protein [Candidatus Saccharibacteria bacterium]